MIIMKTYLEPLQYLLLRSVQQKNVKKTVKYRGLCVPGAIHLDSTDDSCNMVII